MNKFIKSTLAAGALVALGSVNAATVSTTFTVTANVPSICRVDADALDFGTYTPEAGPVVANTTIRVRCTRNTNFEVGLSAGSGGSDSARAMLNGTDRLDYSLFSDAGLIQNWGVITGSETVSGVGAGIAPANAVSLTVYGRILDSATNQNAPAGTYTDTITVTVEYT